MCFNKWSILFWVSLRRVFRCFASCSVQKRTQRSRYCVHPHALSQELVLALVAWEAVEPVPVARHLLGATTSRRFSTSWLFCAEGDQNRDLLSGRDLTDVYLAFSFGL